MFFEKLLNREKHFVKPNFIWTSKDSRGSNVEVVVSARADHRHHGGRYGVDDRFCYAQTSVRTANYDNFCLKHARLLVSLLRQLCLAEGSVTL